MTDAVGGCLCSGIPMNRAMSLVCGTKPVAAFHLDCPQHGVVVTIGGPMRRVVRQQWATVQEALLLRRLEGAKVVERSADRGRALVEWVEWERILPSDADSP